MNGATYILAINLSVAGLLAIAFLALAAYEARRTMALLMAATYAVAMVYFAVEFSIPAFDNADIPVSAAFAIFLVALIAFNAALSSKYQVSVPLLPVLVFLLCTTFLVWLSQGMERQSLLRMAIYQYPYAAIQIVGMSIILLSKRKLDSLDRMLVAVLGLSVAHFIAKPFIALALGGWGLSPQTYLASPYALVVQSLATVLALGLALTTVLMLVRDILAEASSRSEMDSLSGLLNRGGFRRHAEIALRDAARSKRALAVAVADLDHFKAINDEFGHACGDRVIESFASLLRDAGGEGAIAGRLGGEEFAILLPGSNLAGARLFAEGTRSAFAAMPIRGLPSDRHCTASFGVAECLPQDEIDDLMQRADRALYAAKKSGRDRVRVSWDAADRSVSRRGAALSDRG